MSGRVGFWVVGLIALTLASWLIPWGPDWRGAGPLLLALVLVIAGAVVEIGSLGFLLPAPLPRDARPADGEVGVASMVGVRAGPNSHDPQFRRFIAREPAEADAGPAVLGARPEGRSMPSLLGRVVFLSVFLGRDGTPWSDAEIAQAHDALRRAGTWIEREAIRWNAPVNVELADTYFVADDDTPDDIVVTFVPQGEQVQPIEAQATVKALTATTRAADRLGFRDAVDLISRINPRIEADVRVWLLHPRRAGCSFAVPLDQTELAGVSLAVCYAREANFPEPLTRPPRTDPITIAHEVLHLFGAEDKYGAPLHSFPSGAVTARDIMRLNQMPLDRYQIDPLTAVEIGW